MRKAIYDWTVLLVFYLGLTLWTGCGGDENANTRVAGKDARETDGNKLLDRNGHEREERQISELELDSLRAMKARFKITREEYWDDHGGVLGNEYLEVWYPPGNVTVTHGMYVFKLIDQARKNTMSVFGRVPEDRLTVKCTASLKDYDEESGGEWWHYSRIKDDTITFQPVGIMFQRGLAPIAVPREYYEWSIVKFSANRAPRWLEEGLASVLAGEAAVLKNQLAEFPGEPVKMSMEDIESALKKEKDRKASRKAYFNTYRMVDKMIADYGRDKIISAIFLLGEGKDLEEAFEESFGQPYESVVASAVEFTVEK